MIITELSFIRTWILGRHGGKNCPKSCPKFRNPVEKKREGRRLSNEKFSAFRKYLHLRNKTPFPKNFQFSCNTEQFLSICGNFLLVIRNDSFLSLAGIEYSRIWKFGVLSRNIMNFANFCQNNSVFMQNYRGFKKYQLQKKFIFRQIVAKIANFPILG